MEYVIKNYHDESVIFSLECESLKVCVEAAIQSGTNLSGADLSSAYVSSDALPGN